jgi:hypothetical protein
MDKMFNLFEQHKITIGMAEEMAYSAQDRLSFEKAATNIKRYLNVEVSESLVRSVSERVGKIIYEKDVERAEITYAKPEESVPSILEKDKKEGILYNYADGSMVNTIEKDENGSTWREIKLGLVYWDKNSIKREDGKNIITQKDYVAHLGSVEVFKKLMFDASVRAGYGHIKKTVFLGDGAPWIWNMCYELYPDATQILDHSHLKENVYDFSKYLHPNNAQKMIAWAENIMEKIDNGKVGEVIDELPSVDDVKLPSGVPNLRKYIINNKERIKYPEFIEKGYLIGSGAVESGHKGVVQQRLKQAGMRWQRSGGQNIATLRVKSASGKWDSIKDYISAA